MTFRQHRIGYAVRADEVPAATAAGHPRQTTCVAWTADGGAGKHLTVVVGGAGAGSRYIDALRRGGVPISKDQGDLSVTSGVPTFASDLRALRRRGYTNAFEIVCCHCGDDTDLDYRDVSPELQRIRGPYQPIAAGAAAYEKHVARHHPCARPRVLTISSAPQVRRTPRAAR